MGAYCKFCGHRCFVPRDVPGRGRMALATCDAGMALDLDRTGYTHLTATNPYAVTP